MRSTDGDIVDMFLERNEDAINATSEKYGRRIRNIAFRIVGNIQTAEECENDTYLEAWNRIPPSEPRTYLMAFLSRISRTISINRSVSDHRLKRFAYIEELSSEMEQCIASSSSVEKELDAKLLIEAISSFLKKQPKEKRVIFMRRYYYLEKTSAIAKCFGYKESSIRSILFRMRNELREYLEKGEII